MGASMVISVLNLKGGSGKTTVTTNLATAFAQDGKKVMIIDTDKQQSTEKWFGIRPDDANNSIKISSLTDANALRKQVTNYSKEKLFDIILIDGSPHLDMLASMSILISNMIIIPVQPSPYDLWASESIVQRIKHAQEEKPNTKAYFLLNRYNPRTKLGQDSQEALSYLGLPLLKTTLKSRVAYADCVLDGLSVLEWEDEKAKEEILSLYNEIKTDL